MVAVMTDTRTMGTGNVADDDEESLVFADESDYADPGNTCQGAPDGFETTCGLPAPHGPHGPEPLTERQMIIADIRAYADWLEAHPDVAPPDHVDGSYHQHGISTVESIRVARAFADAHNGTKHTSGNQGWVIVTVPTTKLKVEHTIFTNPEPQLLDSWL